MKSRYAFAALLLLAASHTPAAALPAKYDRALAQKQIESLLQEGVNHGVATSAQLAQMRILLTQRPDKVDVLAELLFSEGLDIGTPMAASSGAALLQSLVAKMNDGRGLLEAAVTTGRTQVQAGVGNMPTVGDRGVATTISTGSTAAAAPKFGTSQISDDTKVPAATATHNTIEELWTAAGGDSQKYYEEMSKKAAKVQCGDDPACLGTRFVTGGLSNTPDPTGETRAKPAELTAGQVTAALGGKSGQVTNPSPDGGFTGGTGAIPATPVGGGVKDPPAAVTAITGISAPKAPLGALDPLINPTQDGPTPSGNKPASPSGISNPGKSPGGA